MIYHDDDPSNLWQQQERIRAERKAAESKIRADAIKQELKQTPLHNRPKEQIPNGSGCGGLFMVVALAWCFVACAPNREFKDKAADVLDVARQMHWEGCEANEMLQQDLCDKAYFALVSAEKRLEDEIAKRRRLQAMWDSLEPVIMPYIESGVLTAAQMLVAYLAGNLLGGALAPTQPP